MPLPPPIRRQLSRSPAVPCRSRGYQEIGTVSVRPSARSTTIASRVTRTLSARGGATSLGKVCIPSPYYRRSIGKHKSVYPLKLDPTEAFALLKVNGLEPELGNSIVTLDMHMPRLGPISGVKEQPIRSRAQNGRHEEAWTAPPLSPSSEMAYRPPPYVRSDIEGKAGRRGPLPRLL